MPELHDLDQPNLTIEFDDTGEQISSLAGPIVSYSLNSEYSTPTDEWSIVVYSESNPARLRQTFRPWRPVKLSIDGAQQVIGRIDKIKGEGPSSSLLRVTGRDYLADICDGGQDPALKFTAGMSLESALLSVLAPFGVTTLIGENLTRSLLTGKRSGKKSARRVKASTLQDYKAEDNSGAMELAMRIATRHGVMILPGTTRSEVVVAEPDYSQTPRYSFTRRLQIENPGNILDGVAERDYTHCPTVTISNARQGSNKAKTARKLTLEIPTFGPGSPSGIGRNPEVQGTITSDNNVINVKEKRFDAKRPDNTLYGSDFPVYKPLFYRDKDSRNEQEQRDALKRMLAERLRKTLEYRCTVRGHSDPATGAVYAVDTMARVDDDVEGVHENLWVFERTFVNDGRSGPMTELVMLRPDSFVIGGD